MNEAGISAAQLSAVLLTLELKGLVKQLPGKQYVRES
jgi:predicted Rossmann fold nucleotide-binding protein DprA/Smf involved in DNA uptake